MATRRDKNCGRIAIKNGFLDELQVRELLDEIAEARTQKKSVPRFEELAQEKGLLDEKEASAVAMAARRLEKDNEKKQMAVEGYEILSKLGEGGLATVYRSRQISMNRIVALKILHKQWLSDEEFKKRFLLEARLVGKLSHENLIKVFDVGKDGWKYYYSMEFIEGETCEDILDAHGPMDPVRALHITAQVAKAVDYIKGYNIVHCDIKPGNIMLTRSGVAKLGDFGFVKVNIKFGGEEEGTVLGTPDYISPEQALGRDDIDYRSDIYSLGASLYHLLTGRPPYEGTSSEIMRAHVKKEPPAINQLNPGLSRETVAVVKRMMAKDPGDRYQSMAELFQDLNSAIIAEDPDADAVREGEHTLFDAFKREKFRSKRWEEERTFLLKTLHDNKVYLIVALAVLAVSIAVNIALLLRILS